MQATRRKSEAPTYLTKSEAADYLRVSERTLNRLVHRERLPVIRLGSRSIRFTKKPNRRLGRRQGVRPIRRAKEGRKMEYEHKVIKLPFPTTYSFWEARSACPKKAAYRTFDEIVPVEDNRAALVQGSALHNAIEAYYRGKTRAEIEVDIFDRAFPFRQVNPGEKHNWHIARAMFDAFADRYTPDEWAEMIPEYQFTNMPIQHPDTGKDNPFFTMNGKIDGLIRRDGDEWMIAEYKSATRPDASYLQRLWSDLQIILYVHYARQSGFNVRSVLYYVISKPLIKQRGGETEEEFEARKLDMKMPGRARRKMPESDAEFEARLREHYRDQASVLREEIIIDDKTLRGALLDLWQWADDLANDIKRGHFTRNRRACWTKYGACPYWRLCSSNDCPTIRQNEYTHMPAHSELDSVHACADEELSVF